MKLNVVLFQPEIPQNTGNIMRTCVGVDAKLHLIKPLGFSLDEKHLRRSAVDYYQYINYEVYENLEDFFNKNPDIDIYDEKGGAVLLTLYAADGKIVYVFNDSSVSDALDEGVYYIKLTLPGEAASVSVAAAGDIPTLPHKIGEAGEYVATVKENGGVVYYSFTGALDAASRVTVSVESAASLTVGGVLIAGGEYTFICDGAEILFEISADVAENYNFTITVE